MIITSSKTFTEAYWDMVNKSSGKESTQEAAPVESAKEMSTAANNSSTADFAAPAVDSFWLKLTDNLTAWLRKQAD